MHRRQGSNVMEPENFVVLVDFLRRHVAAHNLAEYAVVHCVAGCVESVAPGKADAAAGRVVSGASQLRSVASQPRISFATLFRRGPTSLRAARAPRARLPGPCRSVPAIPGNGTRDPRS